MDTGGRGPDPIEERLAELERRVAEVERRMATPSPSPTAARMAAPAGAAPAASAPVQAWAPRPGPEGAIAGWVPPGGPRPSARPTVPPPPAAISFVELDAPADEAQPSDRAGFAFDRDLLAELEERLTGRALAWAGGVALVLGALFFLSLAFSRGWIGPEARVLLGLAAGAAALVGGGVLLERGDRLVGHVLAPVGLAIISISLVAATSLYSLVPNEVGLAGAFLSAVVAAVIAVRSDSQVVAAFGLVSVLLAPPMVGASADMVTLAFVGAALVGTTGIALWRTWTWLPPIAFLLSAPQAAAWFFSDPPMGFALAGLAVFWALHAVAAGGEEFRRRRHDLRLGSAGLLLADAAFAVWAGFSMLSGDLAAWRGAFLATVALANLGLGLGFLVRDGERHLFGLLAAATGVAVLAMAAPVQLGTPWVPVAWAAEGAALLWIASVRRHPHALAAGGVLLTLAGLWVAIDAFGSEASGPLDPRLVSLAAYLVAVAFSTFVVRERWLRSLAIALGTLTTSVVAVALLPVAGGIAALAALVVITAALWRLLDTLPAGTIEWQLDGLVPAWLRPARYASRIGAFALPATALAVAAFAIRQTIVEELPLQLFGQVTPPAVPFADEPSLVAAILVAAALAVGFVAGDARVRRVGILAGAGVAAYAIPYEVWAWHVAILWSLIALGVVACDRLDPDGGRMWRSAAACLLTAAALVVVGSVAPPTRLVVTADPLLVDRALWSAAASAAVAIGFGALAWEARTDRRAWMARAAMAVSVVYLSSIAVVDVWSVRFPVGIGLDELRTQAQVALSVLWTVLGVAGFVGGLMTRRLEIRQGGLALLAIATLKVFLFDLSSLDVAYRVISLVALGLLLLGSAWVYGRLKPRGPARSSGPSPAAGGAAAGGQ